jgi:hypothetical protein
MIHFIKYPGSIMITMVEQVKELSPKDGQAKRRDRRAKSNKK